MSWIPFLSIISTAICFLWMRSRAGSVEAMLLPGVGTLASLLTLPIALLGKELRMPDLTYLAIGFSQGIMFVAVADLILSKFRSRKKDLGSIPERPKED